MNHDPPLPPWASCDRLGCPCAGAGASGQADLAQARATIAAHEQELARLREFWDTFHRRQCSLCFNVHEGGKAFLCDRCSDRAGAGLMAAEEMVALRNVEEAVRSYLAGPGTFATTDEVSIEGVLIDADRKAKEVWRALDAVAELRDQIRAAKAAPGPAPACDHWEGSCAECEPKAEAAEVVAPRVGLRLAKLRPNRRIGQAMNVVQKRAGVEGWSRKYRNLRVAAGSDSKTRTCDPRINRPSVTGPVTDGGDKHVQG